MHYLFLLCMFLNIFVTSWYSFLIFFCVYWSMTLCFSSELLDHARQKKHSLINNLVRLQSQARKPSKFLQLHFIPSCVHMRVLHPITEVHSIFFQNLMLDNMASIPIDKISILLSLHCTGHLNFIINHEQS